MGNASFPCVRYWGLGILLPSHRRRMSKMIDRMTLFVTKVNWVPLARGFALNTLNVIFRVFVIIQDGLERVINSK